MDEVSWGSNCILVLEETDSDDSYLVSARFAEEVEMAVRRTRQMDWRLVVRRRSDNSDRQDELCEESDGCE